LKRLSVLGSTGSIGVNTLDVVRQFPQRFTIVGLAAGTNLALLREQIRTFKPTIVSVLTDTLAKELKRNLSRDCAPEIVYGEEGMQEVARVSETDMVVSAIVGSAGLLPTLAAIKSGKDIALANKETLVMAGKLMMKKARDHRVKIVPVDSEHSAIFQVLQGQSKKNINTIILTASGGPFLKYSLKKLETVTPKEALAHPNWKMGKKVTIDSASLMNKGLEVIEAHWLFDIPPEKIKVYIHPQSIVHAMVEYIDRSVIAQLSMPDMRGPIAYALSYPERIPTELLSLNLLDIGKLSFIPPNLKNFPSLGLAYSALRQGGSMPAVLNASNEVAVSAFLKRKIRFTTIPRLVEKAMSLHSPQNISCLEEVMEVDRWARAKAEELATSLQWEN
jgi:1-deoxy-D-xylulose-5-phosphate reductoisomerase